MNGQEVEKVTPNPRGPGGVGRPTVLPRLALLIHPFALATLTFGAKSNFLSVWSVKGMAEFDPPSFTGNARAIIVAMER